MIHSAAHDSLAYAAYVPVLSKNENTRVLVLPRMCMIADEVSHELEVYCISCDPVQRRSMGLLRGLHRLQVLDRLGGLQVDVGVRGDDMLEFL